MKEKSLVSASRRFDGAIVGEVGAFTVTVALNKIGDQEPYFSVQGESAHCGGCMHHDALMAWPEIKPIIDLHLSSYPDGGAMHLVGNGWYQLAGALIGYAGQEYHTGNSDRHFYNEANESVAYRKPTPDECLAIFAEHVRLPVNDCVPLRDSLNDTLSRYKPGSVGWPKVCKAAKKQFIAWMGMHTARFAAEAKAGYELIQSLGHRTATPEENVAALQRKSDALVAVKLRTLEGIPVPDDRATFSLIEVREIIMPHPFHITGRHMAGSRGGTLNPDCAPCGYPDCTLSSSQHVKQKTLFIKVPQNKDLNAVSGLHTYLQRIKHRAEALGIQGFAFPTQ